MPTSAGKTLLAEFAIVQALALYPEQRVAYVVPTRALVNQVTRRLRHDLGPLGLEVEAAVPVIDLDATEGALLRQPFNVLVVTPEKLDLLLRSDHPSAVGISLIVADEAHNIGTDNPLLLKLPKRLNLARSILDVLPAIPLAAQEHEGACDPQEQLVGPHQAVRTARSVPRSSSRSSIMSSALRSA